MNVIATLLNPVIFVPIASDAVKEGITQGQKTNAQGSGDTSSAENVAAVSKDETEAEEWQEVKRKPRPTVGKTKNRSSLSESSHGIAAEELEFQFDEDLNLPARQRYYSNSRYSL